MTENEAIEVLDELNCLHIDVVRANAIEVAIQALEEIQEFRKLGTVEDVPRLLVERNVIHQYTNIGTVRECKIAVERMKPKKPDYEADGYADGQLVYDYAKCPICGHDFEYGINDWECKYCSDCGQKLDWE